MTNHTQNSSKRKVYDVRTKAEFDHHHTVGAEFFPLTKLEAGVMPNISKSTVIITYCSTGVRGEQAAKILRQAGFANAKCIGGLHESDLEIFTKN